MENNYLVYVETEQANQIKILFEILKDILIDAPIEFIKDLRKTNEKKDLQKKEDDEEENDNNGGIIIMSVNPEKTLMIKVLLEGKQFTKFRCKCDVFNTGVNLEHLYKLIKSSGKKDILTIYVDEMSSDKLSFMIVTQEKNRIIKSSLNLLDLDKSEIILTMSCDVAITIDASDFRDLCKEMSGITQNLEIICTKNSITFTGKGDSSKRDVTYKVSDGGLRIKMDQKSTQIVQGIFPIKYLLTISKCANICKNMVIFMKNKKPLFIEYSVATLGTIRVAITPAINENQIDEAQNDD